jgi:hypothetical protein
VPLAAGLRRRALPGALFALALGGAFLGCSGGDRPSIGSTPGTASSVAATGPAGHGTATTALSGSPLDTPSGVTVGARHPCDLLVDPLLAAFGGARLGTTPVAVDATRCRVDTTGGAVEVTVEPYAGTRREAFEHYEELRGTRALAYADAHGVPALTFAGSAATPQPELALFPDDAMVRYRTPAPIDAGDEVLGALVDALNG